MPSTINDRLDGISTSVAIKAPCQAVATTNITLSGEQTVGGVAVVAVNAAGRPDRVLCTGQTNPVENGIWDVSTGAWSRAKDFNGNRDVVQGTLVEVYRAAGLSPFYRVTSANPVLIGTSNITFEEIPLDADVLRADLAIDNDTAKGAALVGYRGMTVRESLDLMRSIKSYGPTGAGADDSSAIQNAIDNNDAIYVDDDYSFSAITIPDGKSFFGPGVLTGLAPTGSKPSEAGIIAAGSEAARLTLMTNYYNATVSVSGTTNIYGTLNLKDCLVSGSSSANFLASGRVDFDNVSSYDCALSATGSGHIESASGLISIDSPSDGLFVRYGGSIVAPSCVVLYATSRGSHVQFGGTISAIGGSFRYSVGSVGVFINGQGTIDVQAGNVSNNFSSGILSIYGGRISAYQTTIDSNGGAGIVSESNSAIYAVESVVTNNTNSGLDASYDGVIQASGSTITGNGGYAVQIRTGGIVNILTATVDRTNRSSAANAAPMLWVQGRGVIYSEDESGTGKTALNADDYDPLYNEMSGLAWIGDYTDNDITAHRANYFAWTVDNSAYTIASDAITLTSSGFLAVDTEAAAASDDLATINGGQNLQEIVITAASAARTVVVKHGTGNIYLKSAADYSLDDQTKAVRLLQQYGNWVEV